jgi:hypothetical protein
MIETADGLESLQKDFAEAGITTDSPGFYEDFQFIRREHKDPTYLDNYARFVQWKDYSDAYLDKADKIVHIVAAEMQLAMQLDANQASYDASPLVFSRILEREGIWNYVVRGSLTVTFPQGSGFEPHWFPAVNAERGFKKSPGYTWVVAPPFQIIDLTIQTQDFPHPVGHLLPKILLEKDVEPAEGDLEEMLTAAALDEIRTAGLSLEEGLDRLAPGFSCRFAPDFPACTFLRGETRFKFVPMKIVTTEESLEQFKDFTSKGRTAIQIYEQEIKPRFLKD